MIMTMKMGRRTQSRSAGSRKSDWVDPVIAIVDDLETHGRLSSAGLAKSVDRSCDFNWKNQLPTHNPNTKPLVTTTLECNAIIYALICLQKLRQIFC